MIVPQSSTLAVNLNQNQTKGNLTFRAKYKTEVIFNINLEVSISGAKRLLSLWRHGTYK